MYINNLFVILRLDIVQFFMDFIFYLSENEKLFFTKGDKHESTCIPWTWRSCIGR
jgi:hypothetical protein